ncbi:tetratricopeptide repeat protein [Neisseria iguanae]|uniref:Tetratricopeptide repeat-containing protein n=1 Tax=Neisseria iguanae TaxID=90242 RepID=A0A2P7TYY7_9NEIS|nr:tetratricopeptide repeat protein [Neisseria iguanae]PSJ79940.1 tetratricopeptide repeat-containing protein [Neisseria iguanae]
MNKAEQILKHADNLRKQKDFDGAIALYKNIRREDSPEAYAKAQFNLGIALKQQGDIEDAITAYKSIRHEDLPKQYAKAQFNLGIALKQKGNIEDAITAYKSIRREDSPEAYAKAQFNLGIALKQKGNIEDAITAYKSIRREDSPEAYAKAQFNLGIALKQNGNIEDAVAAWGNSKEFYYWQAEALIRIEKQYPNLKKILNLVISIIENLRLPLNNNEMKVAHYSRATTALRLLDKQSLSLFRLRTIKTVNDPMEGLTLNRYLSLCCPQFSSAHAIKTNHQESVFISCFTFNHDSLNQFRLYGKENGQEASGVSLVFDSRFFNTSVDSNFTFISDNQNIIESNKIKQPAEPEEKPSNISLLPIYRCIYIDPESGYLSLAQRDEITFYREAYADAGKENTASAQKIWKNYQTQMTIKQEEVKQSLDEIIEHIRKISEVENVEDTLNFLLLPLKYLVKHAAFHEEQECRIMYITDLSDAKIQSDWENKLMYVNYSGNVSEALDKIYLSPGAFAYEDFFRRILDTSPHGSKKPRVHRSTNPFRHKS